MENFDTHKWFKNQYLKESDDPKIGAELEAGMFGTGVAEGEGGGSKSQRLANAIISSIMEIDDSMSYKDFADAVASILIDEYGTHNFTPFMEVLHARLGMNESLNENEDDDLAREINSLFGGNPYVRDGEITFRMKGEFSDREWNEILNLIRSKGLEITRDSNYYDIEPGEREWFPRIDFKLK
tara:strand:- start:464 stop:1012 length:549 start_codon:yes stop_codon:yes gene_type:complete